MERRETFLFYLLGVVGLVVVSILSTNQIERVEIRPLPTHTPAIVITPQSTATSPETRRIDCATIPEGITFGYLPDTATLTHLAGDSLTISGTVYARDFVTPLPDVLIEVWRATPESGDEYFLPFILLKQVRTNANGRYSFTIPKPDPRIIYYHYYRSWGYLPSYFHYQVSYQGHCPSSVQLLSVDSASPENDPSASTPPRRLLIREVKPSDTMLQGSVGIALPVSPPTP